MDQLPFDSSLHAHTTFYSGSLLYKNSKLILITTVPKNNTKSTVEKSRSTGGIDSRRYGSSDSREPHVSDLFWVFWPNGVFLVGRISLRIVFLSFCRSGRNVYCSGGKDDQAVFQRWPRLD